MTTGCCVPSCDGSTKKGLRCFYFPRVKWRRRMWEAQVKRHGWKATRHSRICERHFEQDQYQDIRKDWRRVLKPTAVPTLFDCRREILPPTSMEESARLEEDGRKPPPSLLREALEGRWNGAVADKKEQHGKSATLTSQDWQRGDARDLPSSVEGQSDSVLVKGGDGAALLEATSCLLKATEDIRFRCLSCTFITTDQRGIMSHLVTHEELQFKCQRSSKSSGSMSKLRSNIQMRTSDKSKNRSRPHRCLQCSRDFVKLDSLRAHTRLHRCEKLYKCKHCPKAFAHLSRLTSHTRVHTGEKPYKCELCPEAFACRSTRIQHNRMHRGEKPYKCELCPKAFATKFELTVHNRLHTGEKPYKCDLCPQAFSRSDKLTIHTRTHTGEKPYKCELCPQAFARRDKLTKHTRMHLGAKNLTNGSYASQLLARAAS